MFKIKNGDTRPTYVVALKDKFGEPGEEALDLSEVKKVFIIVRAKGQTGTKLFRKEAEIKDAPNGVVEYVWASGDTEQVPGIFNAEFELEYEDGGIETVPNDGYFEFTITDDLDN